MPILLEPVKFTGNLSNLFPCNTRIDISQHEDDTNVIGTSQCTSNLSNLFFLDQHDDDTNFIGPVNVQSTRRTSFSFFCTSVKIMSGQEQDTNFIGPVNVD